jgi:hypothetical protein
MKRIIYILFTLFSVQLSAQIEQPRIKFNQVIKDSTGSGRIVISSLTDSNMIYSPDFYINTVDSLLILFGDTVQAGSAVDAAQVRDIIFATIDAGLGVEIDTSSQLGILTIQSLSIEDSVYNGTGTLITKGTPLYVVDIQGNYWSVAPAQANDPTKMPVVAIAGENIASGATGLGLIKGHIKQVNTTGLADGAEVYVASGGGYTSTKPTAEGVIIQRLGTVIKGNSSNGSGIINLGDEAYWNDYVDRTELGDTALAIRNDIPLIINDSLTARNFLTENQNITLSGDVTGSGTTAIEATVVDDSHNHIISNVDFLQDSLDAKANDSDLANYVTTNTSQMITGAKTFSTDVEIDGKLDLDDGSDNVFIGTGAGTLNTGISVVGLGKQALQFNEGDYSIAFGTQALARNFADYSYGFGYLALYYNSGAFTSGFGYYALASNSGGSSNGFGREALRNNSGATSNGFGNYALSNNKAANNTAIGHQAGYETSDLTGGSNTFLGYNASYGGNTTITNATAVGANVTLSNSNTVILGNGADVGIGTTSPDYDLEVVGKIYASDSIISNVYAGTSDIRLKQDIEPTDKGLDAVMELNPVSYRFIANAESEKKSYGFIAQEIEEVIPDVVGTRHDGMKVLNYNDLISVLTKAIQEQQIIIEELNQRLIKLENK